MSTSETNEEYNKIKLDLINKKLIVGEYVLEFEHNVEIEEKWKLKAQKIFGETPEVMERAKQELIQLIKGEDFFNHIISNLSKNKMLISRIALSYMVTGT